MHDNGDTSKMASQRFCLRWNNHQSNLLSVFDQLLHAETFTDVTLAVEGQLLKAHKMVLSACSPYFQALFVNHQEKHPIVILKDVPYSDMKSLLDFMYRGEVSVDQDRLTAFLRVAESLRIKGLTEVNEEKCDIPALTNSLLQQSSQTPNQTPPPQLHRIHPYPGQKRSSNSYPSGGAPPNLLMPLLGNALLQPKRKRGRPRKLSGCSNDAGIPGSSPPVDFTDDGINKSGERILSSSPAEMLEVRMGAESFHNEDSNAGSAGEDGSEALMIDEGDDLPEHPTPTKDADSTDYHSCIIRRSSSLHQTEESQARHETSDVIPMITVELLPLCPEDEPNPIADDVSIKNYLEKQLTQADASGIHFLTDDPAESTVDGSNKSKTELLEYLIRNNGSVVCKLCGEILQSRTHWYRHKYKVHIHNTQSVTPMPLFKCHQCSVFFKTRKGYIGHLASRHPDNENSQNQNPEPTGPSNPQLTADNQTLVDESNAKADFSIESIKQEIIDPELAIPKSQVLNYNNVGGAQTKATLEINKKFMRSTKGPSDTVQWAEKRSREEKLVADIIDRVRRECEATGGPAGGARKGYTRRTTSIMNT